jgi:predicted nucleotidyltransferase
MDKGSLSTITGFLKEAYSKQLQGILLFGSQANGTATENSDVDLGILLDGMADPVKSWENAQVLAAQLGRDVDLVDLRAATTILQKEAIMNGCWIWQQSALACDQFELQVIAMYQQLQYDRRDILEDIKRRLNNE